MTDPDELEARAQSLAFAQALAAAYEIGDGQHIHDLIHSRPDEVAVFCDLVSAVSQLTEQLAEATR